MIRRSFRTKLNFSINYFSCSVFERSRPLTAFTDPSFLWNHEGSWEEQWLKSIPAETVNYFIVNAAQHFIKSVNNSSNDICLIFRKWTLRNNWKRSIDISGMKNVKADRELILLSLKYIPIFPRKVFIQCFEKWKRIWCFVTSPFHNLLSLHIWFLCSLFGAVFKELTKTIRGFHVKVRANLYSK